MAENNKQSQIVYQFVCYGSKEFFVIVGVDFEAAIEYAEKIKCEWNFWGKSHLVVTSSPFCEHGNVSNFFTTCLSAIMVGSMCSKLALPYRGLLDPLSADQLLGSESDS